VLATYFGQRMAAVLGWDEWPGFGPRALAAMEGHDWPGNVRELRNVIERAIYRWADPEKPVDALSFDPFASPWQPAVRKVAAKAESAAPTSGTEAVAAPSAPPSGTVSDLRAAVDAYEKQILSDTMARCRFNQKIAAEALGLSYDQIRHALKKHGLN
jgi:psp operon transcriptional activator